MSNIDKHALNQEKIEWLNKLADMEYCKSNPGNWLMSLKDTNMLAQLTLHSQALLDELEAKDATIATQQQGIRTLLNDMEQATDKRNYDITGQKRLIGWRASDYTDETSDPELAKNWAAAIGVLPIFEGDVNTKLSSAGIGVKVGMR